MQARETRITTTHVGSLPRNSVLSDLLIRQGRGEPVDAAALRAANADAVGAAVGDRTRLIARSERLRVRLG